MCPVFVFRASTLSAMCNQAGNRIPECTGQTFPQQEILKQAVKPALSIPSSCVS